MNRTDGLTGIEQYLFERAGYFVRRGLVPPAAVGAMAGVPHGNGPAASLAPLADTPLLNIVTKLLDGAPWLDTVGTRAESDAHVWRRGCGLPVNAPVHELAGHQLRVEARVAVAADDALELYGGTHCDPLPPELADALAADPAADLDGAVRLRLAPGDVAFLQPCILQRQAAADRAHVLSLSFASRLLGPLEGDRALRAADLPPWLSSLVRPR